MAAINVTNTETAYGRTSWNIRSTMSVGGSDDWPNRVKFPTLSSGYQIDSLSFNFYKQTTASYTETLTLYATSDGSILGNNMTAATLLGNLTFSGVNGWKSITFTRSMMDVIQKFTGTWYLLFEGQASTRTEWTGGQSTNACYMSGTYTTTTMKVNVGGATGWTGGVPWVNVGGTTGWVRGVAWVNVGGTTGWVRGK